MECLVSMNLAKLWSNFTSTLPIFQRSKVAASSRSRMYLEFAPRARSVCRRHCDEIIAFVDVFAAHGIVEMITCKSVIQNDDHFGQRCVHFFEIEDSPFP